MGNFTHSSTIPFSQKSLCDYHLSPGALQRLIPPWEDISLLRKSSEKLIEGCEVTLQVPLFPGIKTEWLATHENVNPPHGFTDRQVSGPFALWKHDHTFAATGDNQSTLTDSIEYKLPLSPLSDIFANWFVQWKLDATFRYRHLKTANDLAHLNTYPKSKIQTVLITGASGLVGRELTALLQVAGYTVLTLSRRASENPNSYQWNIEKAELPIEALERADAVIHLAGEGIANKRWSDKQKAKILKSRVDGTRLIVDSFKKTTHTPQVFISASANGIYGSREDEILVEDSSLGDELFIAEVGKQWEAESLKAEALGIRTFCPRIGIVLTPAGGALQKMLPAFLSGVAGPLGNGKQWMSWITIDDLVYGLHAALENEQWSGAFNFTAPNPTTNSEFTQTLGKVLSRPTLLPAPEFALRIAFGELADELLLSSIRCIPQRLEENDFQFYFSDLESGLRHILGR